MDLRQRYEAKANLGKLKDHPANPRQGDDAAVADSVAELGFYGAIVAQASTGYILAGHTRRRVLAAAGEATGPVIWLDVDDDTARRILLADNRTAELAAWDEAALADLLAELGGEGLLAGTGFTADEMADLSEQLEIPAPPPSITRHDEERNEREDRAQRYENTTLRQITLVMQVEDYEPLVLALEAMRTEWGVPSYAAVIQRLVADHQAATAGAAA